MKGQAQPPSRWQGEDGAPLSVEPQNTPWDASPVPGSVTPGLNRGYGPSAQGTRWPITWPRGDLQESQPGGVTRPLRAIGWGSLPTPPPSGAMP